MKRGFNSRAIRSPFRPHVPRILRSHVTGVKPDEPPGVTGDTRRLFRTILVSDSPNADIWRGRINKKAKVIRLSNFNGRTVLVTGASGGIGGETVRQLGAAASA